MIIVVTGKKVRGVTKMLDSITDTLIERCEAHFWGNTPEYDEVVDYVAKELKKLYPYNANDNPELVIANVHLPLYNSGMLYAVLTIGTGKYKIPIFKSRKWVVYN